MTTFETIIQRRSIRKFLNKEINIDLLHKIIYAGMYAPSARNEQPWNFIIITDREILNEITTIHPHSQMLHHAPAAILVCSDQFLEKSEEYWIQDCAAATQNILLMATESGLGSCWLGVYPRKDRIKGIQKLCKLPKHITPFSIIALGYANEIKTIPDDRLKPERIFINKWIERD